jgi:hypothetical protein
MSQQLWVEPVGDIVLARLRGRCDEQILKECQHRVFTLVKDTRQVKVLYDALELEDPTVDMALLQQKMDAEASARLGPVPLRHRAHAAVFLMLEHVVAARGEAGRGQLALLSVAWPRQAP